MIRVICVGKLKEDYWKMAAQEYLKRLSKYTKVELIEVPDEGLLEEKTALRKEKERIEKWITEKDFLVTLEIEGKESSSVEFASKLDSWQMQFSSITFLIGGSYGLDPELKARSNYALSFSKMTFPHQMFRVILLEQLYRSFKISHHESYHK